MLEQIKIRASKFLNSHGAREYFGRPVTMHEIIKFGQNNWKKFHRIPMSRGWRILKIREENEDE